MPVHQLALGAMHPGLVEELQGSVLRPQPDVAEEQQQPEESCAHQHDAQQEHGAEGPASPPAPLPPRLQLAGPPQATNVGHQSCSFAWEEALLSRPVDDGQHGDQEAFCYTLTYALQLQELDLQGGSVASASAHVQEAHWHTAAEGTHTAEVHNLRPGRHYAARIVATAAAAVAGEAPVVFPGVPSECCTFRTVPTAPGPLQPPALSARARNSLKLKWSPPEETGGEAIQEYVLEMQPAPLGWEQPATDAGFYEMYRGDERSAKVARLQPGVRYTFRLKAANMLGSSPWSLCSAFSTQASVPAAPEPPVQVAATQDSVSLEWRAPADNGAPISDYTLEVDDGRGADFRVAYVGSATAATISQLQSGLPYQFRLRADNSEGRSTWSAVSQITTAARAPTSPLGLSVVGVDRTSVTLAWSAPASDGGSPLLGYQVELQAKTKAAEHGLGSGWATIFEGPSTACTFGGLQAGCTYLVRVNAHNAAGTGQFSIPIQVSTAADVPWQPEAPDATPEARAFLLEWKPPAHDGGSPITTYRVEMRCASEGGDADVAESDDAPHNLSLPHHFLAIYSGPECCVKVTDLVPGTTYISRVHAINAQGASPWSPLGSATTLPTVPAAPAAPVVGACSSTALALSWDEPSGQGSRVVSYTVNMARVSNAGGAGSHGSSHGAASLANGGMANGHGNHQGPGSGHAVSSESGSVDGDASVDASAGVSSDSGSLRHQLRWDTVFTGPATSCDVRNLEPASTYAFRVRAHNAAGGSPWGQRAVATTQPAAPSAPSAVHASAYGPGEVRVTWQAPLHDHGAAVSSYSLEMAAAARASSKSGSAAVWRQAWQGPGHEAIVGELQPGRVYQFRVRAHNVRGAGPWSEPAATTTHAAPPAAPRSVTFSKRSATSLKVSWSPPLDDNGAGTRMYVLEAARLGPLDAGSGGGGSGSGGSGSSVAVLGCRSGKLGPLDASSSGRERQEGQGAAPGARSNSGGRQGQEQQEGREEEQARGAWAAVHSGSELSANVTHLSPGTQYAFRVAAVNSAGQGPWSEEGTAATALRPPPAPAGLEAVVQAAEGAVAAPQLLLSWCASPVPVSERVADVVGFEVEARPVVGQGTGNGHVSKHLGRVSSYVLAGLQPGCSYKVLLRAVGAGGAGHSAWSEPVLVTLAGTALLENGNTSDAASSTGAPAGDGAKSDTGTTKRRRPKQERPERQAHENFPARPAKRFGSSTLAPKPKGMPPSKRKERFYSFIVNPIRRALAEVVGKRNVWWVELLLLAVLLAITCVVVYVYLART